MLLVPLFVVTLAGPEVTLTITGRREEATGGVMVKDPDRSCFPEIGANFSKICGAFATVREFVTGSAADQDEPSPGC